MLSQQEHNMSRRLLLSALLVAYCISGGEARPWSYDFEYEIPTATAAPAADTVKLQQLRPTPFRFVPSFVNKRLNKRVEYPETVCGFIGGDVGLPATCSSGSICIWDTAHSVVGCTPTVGGGTLAVYTSCVEDNGDDDDENNPFVNTCREDDECYRNTYEAVNGQQFYQFGCGQSDFATTVLTQPSGVSGQSAAVVLTSIDMSGSSSQQESSTSSEESSTSTTEPPSSTTSSPPETSSSSEDSSTNDSSSSRSTTNPPSSSTSGSGGSTTSSGSNPSSTSGSATPIPSDDGSSTNVGAIAGGVVGGVAVLALIAGLLIFFRRRKNKENNRRISEASLTSSGPKDQGEHYEPKELDARSPEVRPELPGDSYMTMGGPSKAPEPVELPGSEVPATRAPEYQEKPSGVTGSAPQPEVKKADV